MTTLFWVGVKSKLVHSINIMLGSFSVDLNQKQLSEDLVETEIKQMTR